MKTFFKNLFGKTELKLSKPKSNNAEVLLCLIENGKVSIFDFPYLSGFRSRVSELKLKYNLNLITNKVQGKNKFGNTYTYCIHFLSDKERENAIRVYNKINV